MKKNFGRFFTSIINVIRSGWKFMRRYLKRFLDFLKKYWNDGQLEDERKAKLFPLNLSLVETLLAILISIFALGQISVWLISMSTATKAQSQVERLNMLINQTYEKLGSGKFDTPLCVQNKGQQLYFFVCEDKTLVAIDEFGACENHDACYQSADQDVSDNPVEYRVVKDTSEQTVSEIGTKRDTNWQRIDKASLGKTQTDLKDTQSATIYTVNQMAQALMDGMAAR